MADNCCQSWGYTRLSTMGSTNSPIMGPKHSDCFTRVQCGTGLEKLTGWFSTHGSSRRVPRHAVST
eukprot:1137571-Pelagomonas_calceolata.AAC.1